MNDAAKCSSEELMILDSVDRFLERDVRPVARELESSDTLSLIHI